MSRFDLESAEAPAARAQSRISRPRSALALVGEDRFRYAPRVGSRVEDDRFVGLGA
jgi:hypothetical protein